MYLVLHTMLALWVEFVREIISQGVNNWLQRIFS